MENKNEELYGTIPHLLYICVRTLLFPYFLFSNLLSRLFKSFNAIEITLLLFSYSEFVTKSQFNILFRFFINLTIHITHVFL